MSLKIEQRLAGVYLDTESEPRFYTTGAHLVPLKVNEYYVWVVEEFEDDTYDVKGNVCSPLLFSKNLSSLVNSD